MSPFFPALAIQGSPDQWVHTATYRPVKAASRLQLLPESSLLSLC